MAEQTTTELKQLRAKRIAEMRGILDIADGEGRPLTGEERQKYDKIEADVDAYTATIERRDRVAHAEATVEAQAGEARVSRKGPRNQTEVRDSDEYRGAFDRYLRFGPNSLSGDETRALQEGTDSEGGYLTETVLERTLVETLAQVNVMRRLANVINTSSDRNIPVESTVGTASWTAEEAAYTESDSAFTQVSLSAYKIGTIMKISDELMQDSVFALAPYVGSNFGRRIGEAEEAAFVAGDGSGKPTGATSGASAGVTAAGTAAITADEVYDLAYSLKRQYRRGASWLMHDSTIKAVRQLKDTTNQYLWQPGLAGDEPDRLAGRPVETSYDMPELAAGNVTVLFGDFSMGYIIADRGATSFLRLNELYAANGFVAIRAARRVDGKVVLSEAIKKLTQAAS